MVCYWSQQGNAVFNALAMKCFQLCFMARAKAVKRPEHGLQYGQNRSLLDSWSESFTGLADRRIGFDTIMKFPRLLPKLLPSGPEIRI
jgi:hypothetical protein